MEKLMISFFSIFCFFSLFSISSTFTILKRNSQENNIHKSSIESNQNDKQTPQLFSHLDYDSLDDIQYIDENVNENPVIRGKKNIKQWDHWGKWTECSATCGVGKSVRWRHCVSAGCADGEKEAQIKTCTMKPCT